MAKVELKKPVVEEIANSINGAASVVLVSYKGITVEQDTNSIGSLAADLLIQAIRKEPVDNRKLIVKGTLLKGETVRNLTAV